MSDYRLGLSIEHGEDRSYVVHEATGQRYEISSYDMQRKEYPSYLYDNVNFDIPHSWDLYLGLVEVPPVPVPESPPKRRLSDLGLRRPK